MIQSSWQRNQEISIIGEDLATKFLKKQGYRILSRRFRCKFGEIDIIAQREKWITFIEVKTRSGQEFGDPLESITPWKLQRLFRASQFFLRQWKAVPKGYQMEFLGIGIHLKEGKPRIESISLFPD